MTVELVLTRGAKAGQAIALSTSKFFIGRADDCHLRPKSDLVSRHHCAILIEDGYVGVRDFGSKNGTFVNGERVAGEIELKKGDKLEVGDLEFELRLAIAVGGEKKPKVTSVQEAAARTVETAKEEAAKESTAEQGEPDIDSWLQDGEGSVDAETPTVDYYSGGDTIENQASEETVTPEQGADQERKDNAQKHVPKKPLNSSATSQNAAADMLRSFFKGR